MTLQDLSRYYKLREQLERDDRILASLEANASTAVQVITGMPHTSGVSDKVGNLAAEIADMREVIRLLRLDVYMEGNRLTALIDGIGDEYIRTILRLRFLRCLTWPETALVIGGDNTAEGVKSVVYRYLKLQRRDAP